MEQMSVMETGAGDGGLSIWNKDGIAVSLPEPVYLSGKE